MNEPNGALSEDELRQLDAGYEPFPSFEDWLTRNHVDEEEWSAFREIIRIRREELSDEALGHARQFVIRAAAVDTGAIEGLYKTDRGFTFTVAQQAPHWEKGLAERGPLAPALFEAQLRTYELVLDAVTKARPVTEAWIRRLHEELCSPQETYLVHTPVGPQLHPLPRGEYKRYPNHVRQRDGIPHAYAPVDRVADEMHRLVAELQSERFQAAHPVLQASYAHYALVVVHPFADGNGRVARALASTYFYRELSLPLVVLDEQDSEYFDALAAADGGDWQPFVSFIAARGIDAVQLADDELSMDSAATPDVALARLREVLTTAAGVTHQELDGRAVALLKHVDREFEIVLSERDLPSGVAVSRWESTGGATEAPPGYRPIQSQGEPYVRVQIHSQPPASASAVAQIAAYVAAASDQQFPLLLVEHESGRLLRVRLADAGPVLSPGFQLRLRQWVERLTGELIATVAQQAEDSLRDSGYFG